MSGVPNPVVLEGRPRRGDVKRWRCWIVYGFIGVISGFFSGLFGVGGGVIIVPLLVLIAYFDQRRASGTSLTAILPIAVAGVIGYAIRGDVDWHAAVYLAGGAFVGSLGGSWLLHRVPLGALRWIFVGFLTFMAANMFLAVPDRGAVLEVSHVVAVALVAVGLVVGTLSGLLGVGGGVIVVPILVVAFGMSDLVAKGTSLLMVIPTAVGGTIANVRRRNSDLSAAV